MRILKREVQGLHEDETVPYDDPPQAQASSGTANGFPPAELAAAPQPDQQQSQIDALQQQIRDLQRAAAMDPAPVEAQRTQQSS
jgi:hypothetical protein